MNKKRGLYIDKNNYRFVSFGTTGSTAVVVDCFVIVVIVIVDSFVAFAASSCFVSSPIRYCEVTRSNNGLLPDRSFALRLDRTNDDAASNGFSRPIIWFRG